MQRRAENLLIIPQSGETTLLGMRSRLSALFLIDRFYFSVLTLHASCQAMSMESPLKVRGSQM